MCALQEMAKVLQQSTAQCNSYKDRFLALQQQHDNLQLACRQLHQDLDAARSELKASQANTQLSASQQIKGPKAIGMQANSNILDSCNDDDLSAHSARAKHMSTVQPDGHPAPAKDSCKGNDGHDALHIQQLAEHIAACILQQDLLAAWPTSLLHSLEDTLQHAVTSVRSVARTKASQETLQAKTIVKQMEQTIEQLQVCSLCMDQDMNTVLSCGHQFCEQCCSAVSDCPFCRSAISGRIKIFRS